MHQQAKLNETIQLYKESKSSPSTDFFYQKESELLAKVRSGNTQTAKALLNELIGHVLFFEGGKLDAVRIRAIELTTLLSRVAVDSGAHVDSIYSLNGRYLDLLYRERNLDDLCYLLQEIVESFMEAAFIHNDKGNTYIRHALHYISDNYSRKLTLAAVAGSVGLSANHFSTLFHETVGMSFQDYLSQLRVEESKRLLLSTDYTLSDIAIAMGFSDQSHYCRVFKKVTGLSPGKFRNN